MAKIPAGAVIEPEAPRARQPIPAGADIVDEDVAAKRYETDPLVAPGAVEPKGKLQQLAEYLKSKAGDANDYGNELATAALVNIPVIGGLVPRAYAAGHALSNTLNGQGGFVQNYNSELKDAEATANAAERAHPQAAIVGSYLAPPVGKGLSLVQRLAVAGGIGATSGALMAPSDDPAAQARGFVGGGLAGATLQGVGELATPASTLSDYLRNFSGKMATNVAAGGKAQIGDKLGKIGLETASDRAVFGNELLDKGMIPTGLGWKSPVEVVAGRAENLSQSAGAKQGNILKQVNDTGFNVDPAKYQQLSESNLGKAPDELAKSKAARDYINQLGQLRPGAEDPKLGGITGVQGMKSRGYDKAYMSTQPSEEQRQLRRAISGTREGIEGDVESVLGADGRRQLVEANKDFGFAQKVKEISEPSASRAAAGSKFGPLATAATITGLGAATGHAEAGGIGGLGAGALHLGGQFLKARGPTIAARGGRIGSDLSSYIGEKTSNPATGGGLGSLLDRYLGGDGGESQPQQMSEEERLKKGADNFASKTGGGN